MQRIAEEHEAGRTPVETLPPGHLRRDAAAHRLAAREHAPARRLRRPPPTPLGMPPRARRRLSGTLRPAAMYGKSNVTTRTPRAASARTRRGASTDESCPAAAPMREHEQSARTRRRRCSSAHARRHRGSPDAQQFAQKGAHRLSELVGPLVSAVEARDRVPDAVRGQPRPVGSHLRGGVPASSLPAPTSTRGHERAGAALHFRRDVAAERDDARGARCRPSIAARYAIDAPCEKPSEDDARFAVMWSRPSTPEHPVAAGRDSIDDAIDVARACP